MSDSNAPVVKGIFVSFEADTHKLKESLDAGKEALKEFGIDVNKLKDFLTGGAGLAVAFAVIGKEAIEMALEFEEGVQIIGRSTGAVGAQLEGLTDVLRDVVASGAEQSVTELAEAISQLNIRLGVSGKPLEELTKAVADFADVNRVDLKQAVIDVTQVLAKFDLGVSDMEPLLDKLTLASQKTGIAVDTLSKGLLSGGAIFKSAGLSINDSISLLAGFEKSGVNAESALSGLRVAITGFQNDGKNAGEELKKLITEIENTVDPTEAAQLAASHFGRSTQEIFQAIRSGTLDIEDFNKQLEESEGTLNKTQVATKTNIEVYNELQRQLVGLSAEGFGSILTVTKPILQLLSDLLTAFESLPEPVKLTAESVVILAGAVKIANVALVAFGSTMQFNLGPILLVSSAVIALIALCTELSKTQDRLKLAQQEQIESLKRLNLETKNIFGNVTSLNESNKLTEAQIQSLKKLYPELTKELSNNNLTLKEAVKLTNDLNLKKATQGLEETTRKIAETQVYIKKLVDTANSRGTTDAQRAHLAAVREELVNLKTSADNYKKAIAEINGESDKTVKPVEKVNLALIDFNNQLKIIQASLKANDITTEQALNNEISLRQSIIASVTKEAVEKGAFNAEQRKQIDLQKAAIDGLNAKLLTLNSFDEQLNLIGEKVRANDITIKEALEAEISLRQGVIDRVTSEAESKGIFNEEQRKQIEEQKAAIENLKAVQISLVKALGDGHPAYEATGEAVELLIEKQQAYLELTVNSNKTIKESYQELAGQMQTVAGILESNVFGPLGASLVKQQDLWETLSKGVVHSIGAIVKAIGDQLTAMSAADFVKGVAAAASVVGAAAAPGFFASSGVLAGGAAAAYITAGALNAYALGTDYAQGGLSVVGEQGREILNIPQGSSVLPNNETEKLLGGEQQITVPVIVNLGTKLIFKELYQASKNKTLLIDAKAIV